MDWYKVFYLFSLADKISDTMYVLSVLCSIVLGLSLLAYFVSVMEQKEPKISGGLVKRFWLPALLCWFLWAFIPDRQDMTLIIAGGSVGQFIINDDNAKELPADITRFLRSEILEATADLSASVKQDLNIKTKRDSLMEMGKEELIKLIEKQ